MTPRSPGALPKGLPQLSGGPFWLYRGLWSILATGAIAASIRVPIETHAAASIVAFQALKSITLLGVATILLVRRQRDPVAALLALAFLTWAITSSFDFATSLILPQVLDRFRFLFFALALLLYPDGCWRPPWTRAVAAISVASCALGVIESVGLLPTRLFLPLAIPCILAGIASLITRFRRTSSYAIKQQLKWVAFGLVAGVGLILCARAGRATSSLHDLRPSVLWDAMFQAGIVIVALGFLVSLLRYRLFDAETVISRSAAYALLTIVLVASFGGTEALIQNAGQAYLGMNLGSVSGGMAAAVAAVLLQPFHERITNWAEDRFQPDLKGLKRDIPELLARLSQTRSTRKLGAAVLPQFNKGIHSIHSAMLLGDRPTGSCGVTAEKVRCWWRQATKAGQLAEIDAADRIFPVRLPIGQAPSGATIWLLFGPRPDGTLYGREDLDAVRSTFPALKHALGSALLAEALDSAVDRREKRLRAELGVICARLESIERTFRPEGERLVEGNALVPA